MWVGKYGFVFLVLVRFLWEENIDRGFMEEIRIEDMVICKNICFGVWMVYNSSLILYIREWI